MTTRKIIDPKQNGEKVWLKSHAKATFMSNGSTVEDTINNIQTDGGGITTETDPIFSASPAAGITEENISSWNDKVDKVEGKQLSTEDFTTLLKQKLDGLSNYDDTEIQSAVSKLRTDLDTLVSGDTTTAIKTFNEVIAFLDGLEDTEDLASIIASIEQQIAAKYTKPSTGIPKTDLASEVQTSLGKADTALQSYTEQYKGTVTGVKVNGTTKNPSSGVVDLGTVITAHQTLKTINGESIVGSGDITVQTDANIQSVDTTETVEEVETNTYVKYVALTLTDELKALVRENIGVLSTSDLGTVDLSNYYTKSQVDELIPDDYLTSSSLSGYATQTWVNNKNYAKVADIPTNVSELTNDLGYLTSIPSEYITETELEEALGGVISINEYVTWNVELIDSSARLDITLFSYSAIEAVNNYEGIVNALEKVGSSIQMIGSGFDATLSVSYIESTLTLGTIKGRILYGNLTYLLSGKFIAKILTNNNDHIWILIDRNSYLPVDCLNVTYSLLKAFVDNSVLVPGRKYAITDYTCIYRQPVSEVEMEVTANDIEQIICTATSSNTLDENVTVKRSDGYAKIIECRYSIDPEIVHWTKGMTSKTPKGVIYHMKDEYENEANYDFKHVKFRRWAITDISANFNDANGSKNNESPYRFKANANSTYLGSASNERFRVGSGQSIDETLITNIFNGTWSACTTELALGSLSGSATYEFTTTYAKNCHKPYTRTEYTIDKYLAWQTDMNGTNGLSYNAYSSIGIGGLSNVTVDATLYKDVYTFHCNDGDLSEIKNCILNVKLNNLTNGTNEDRSRLPNTCFILSDGLISYTDSVVLENITINTGSDNTFLIRDYSNKKTASLVDIYFNHVKSSLFVVWNWAQVRFNGLYCRYNYINADLEQVTISDSWTYNVIFGRIENVSAGRMQWNLWYNAFLYIQWNNSSSWITPIDGYKSQYTTLKGYTHANILAPLQYCTFDYHINANTFRNFYNKGVIMRSNKQGISFGRIAYSVLEYGGGNYYADQILNCYFDSVAFYNPDYKFGNVHGWDPSRNKLPKMKQVYVCGGTTGHVVDYNTTIPTSWLNTELHPSNLNMGGKLIIYYDNSAGTYKKTDMFTMLKAHAS